MDVTLFALAGRSFQILDASNAKLFPKCLNALTSVRGDQGGAVVSLRSMVQTPNLMWESW